MAGTPSSPEPGFYVYDTPTGWEDDEDEAVLNEYYGLKEDAVLQAMRLEAESEQDAAYEKSRGPMLERARHIKKYLAARRQLKFNKTDPRGLSALSVSSYETDDFMSEPSMSIHELKGEAAWLTAYKAKARRRKQLRKLIAGSDKSPVKAKSPFKIKMPSPTKIAQAYANQSPAIQQAVAAVLSTPKKFGDINLDSSDEEDHAPTKFVYTAKKSFFADPNASPIKTPSPYKPKPVAIKKSFFPDPTCSP